MTLEDVRPLLNYWRREPAAHVVLGAVHLKRTANAKTSRLAPENDVSPAELIAAGVMIDNTKK